MRSGVALIVFAFMFACAGSGSLAQEAQQQQEQEQNPAPQQQNPAPQQEWQRPNAPPPATVWKQSLAGVLLRYVAGAKQPVPQSGASVFVMREGTTQEGWVGPSLTDDTGRYAFYDLAPGSYRLRVFVEGVPVWEQLTNVPGQVKPIVYAPPTGVHVIYHKKPHDSVNVMQVLGNLGVSVVERPSSPSVANIATNTLWVGSGVPLDSVKLIASRLIQSGVRLTSIESFRQPSPANAHFVEVGASAQHQSLPALTVSDVSAMAAVPRAR